MSLIENVPRTASSNTLDRLAWMELLKKLGIWVLFFGALYLARDFFFVAFMTFLFCYLILAVVGRALKRLSPNQDRPGLRRLLTLAVFVLTPLGLLGIGILIAPRLLEQGRHLTGWLGQVSPETEIANVLAGFIGPSEFKEQYGTPQDPRYQKALEEFRSSGESHVQAYNEFPKLEAWVERDFDTRFTEAEAGRTRARLMREGTSSKEFEDWFLKVKAPKLQEMARKQPVERSNSETVPLVQAAPSSTPQQLLEIAKHNPAGLSALQREWVQDMLERDLAAAKRSPSYLKQFGDYYAGQHAASPRAVPYTFEQYIALRNARPQGRRVFGETLEKLIPTAAENSEARLRADFEAAKKHDLFKEWWGTSAIAKFIRQQIEPANSAESGARLQRLVFSLLNVPVDLATALILSFFICIDFPRLRAGALSLRETWLRGVYDEFVPALAGLGELVGRAMHAQGMVSLCNATTMFIALTILGVEHAVLLSVGVFILCLVPTLGMIISWVLIVAVAVIQPGGGGTLALEVSGAVLVVVLLETFIFSPRFLGRTMDLHPVLMIALLPLAQYFFGVWGLILATPVAVYVIHVLILQRGLPGSEQLHKSPT